MKEHPDVYVLRDELGDILDVYWERGDAENVRLAMMEDDIEEYGFAFDYTITSFKVIR